MWTLSEHDAHVLVCYVRKLSVSQSRRAVLDHMLILPLSPEGITTLNGVTYSAIKV